MYEEDKQLDINDEPVITNETWGFTVVIENESGGSLGTWCLTMDQVRTHLDKAWNTGDYYIKIIPTQYKDRMRLE